MYGVGIERCTDCTDGYLLEESELCYESIFSKNCYSCRYVIGCEQCSFSDFLVHCRGCKECICCVDLANAQYCIGNTQLSKEEYFIAKAHYERLTPTNIEHAFALVKTLLPEDTTPFFFRGRVEECSGIFLWDTERCHSSSITTKAQDCAYILFGIDVKLAADCSWGSGEYGVEQCECFPMPSHSFCNLNSYGGSALAYCDTCMNGCSNLMGCVGLRHGEYSILNKRYSREEYGVLRERIIGELSAKGELGEFFSSQYSFFTPEESCASDPVLVARDLGIPLVPSHHTPCRCGFCKKKFKVIEREREFCKKMNVEEPFLCFECRIRRRGGIFGLFSREEN